MKLLDTNILVYARNRKSPFHHWAIEQIIHLAKLDGEGAGLSAVSVAELCAEEGVVPADFPREIESFGIEILDWPQAAAPRCGEAYRAYRRNRKKSSGQSAPKMPLPDFFIGAHAEWLGVDRVTNDPDRFRTHFPSIRLITPPT